MFERMKRLFDNGSLNADGLKRAVAFGWITAEQFAEITGLDYAE